MKKYGQFLFLFLILFIITGSLFGKNKKSELPEVRIACKTARKYKTLYYVGSDWTDATIQINGKKSLQPEKIKIKERGNSTRGNGKLPYSIKFKNETEVLGMKAGKRWVLLANALDRSLIRTDFASYLNTKIFNSTWAASFTPVNLYFNDTYIGTYDFGECNKISQNRVNIPNLKDFAKNDDVLRNIEDYGFIAEIDTANETAERISFYSEKYMLPFTLKDPDFSDKKYSDEECELYKNYAKSRIDEFENILVKDDFEQHYEKYIDVDSFVDWYLVNEFSKNSDAVFQRSVFIYYNPKDRKLHLGPSWDFDLAFGNYNCSYKSKDGELKSLEDPEGWYILGGLKRCEDNDKIKQYRKKIQKTDGTYYYLQSYWINRLFESESFKKAVQKRWTKKRRALKKAIEIQIQNMAGIVEDSVPENEMRLPRIGVETWNGPSNYAERTTYQEEVDYLYNWCLRRFNWMDEEIRKL